MIDSERFFVLYLLFIIGPVTGLWVGSAWRDRKKRVTSRSRWLYRCPKCSHFLESDELVEKSQCPVCGGTNEQLKI